MPDDYKSFEDEVKMSEDEAEISKEEFRYNPENEEVVKKNFWGKVKKVAGKIPFTRDAVSMYYCAIDAKTPLYAKGIAFGALAYFIAPIDAIPDVLAGLGFTDDTAVIAAALTAISKNITGEHKEKAEKFFDDEDGH